MDPVDVVKKAISEIEKGYVSPNTYTDDLKFSGPVPAPIGRTEYVGLLKSLIAAIPDWKFNAKDYSFSGDTVKVTFAITGTHTEALRPIVPGMDGLRATYRRIKLPDEPTTIKVRGDKICEIIGSTVPGGGVMGLLDQLGVQLKKAA